MDLLWPDVAAPRARHSLAQALTVLKEKIGRDQLVVQRASIALAAGSVQVDVGQIDAPETQIRGQFLDGFEVPGAVQFEQWKDEWRAKLMPRIRECLVRQMDGGRRLGRAAAGAPKGGRGWAGGGSSAACTTPGWRCDGGSHASPCCSATLAWARRRSPTPSYRRVRWKGRRLPAPKRTTRSASSPSGCSPS